MAHRLDGSGGETIQRGGKRLSGCMARRPFPCWGLRCHCRAKLNSAGKILQQGRKGASRLYGQETFPLLAIVLALPSQAGRHRDVLDTILAAELWSAVILQCLV
uniref:Uncharacterized protein n=1 Tax=Sphaerodactylus townsendi TaxID=933632 RepID=A0ACB8F8U9_9SAUR